MRLLSVLLLVGCATTPADLLSLMDADSDSALDDAVSACVDGAAPGQRTAVRMAAAKTLGRLRAARPEAIEALGRIVESDREKPEVRGMAAWALGEMRNTAAVRPLVRALRTRVDPQTGTFILDGLAKSYAVLPTDEAELVGIVEAMVYFSANQKTEVGGVYDVLGARLRTVSVNVKVLGRAVDALESRKTPEQLAEVYGAAFELLARLDATTNEISAGPAEWKTRVEESVRQTQRAYVVGDRRTHVLLLWYVGTLARLAEIGRPVADAFVGDGTAPTRPTLAEDPTVRLLAAWALTRMVLFGVGPKRALERDLLPNETDPAVLQIFAGPRGADTLDPLQKVSGTN